MEFKLVRDGFRNYLQIENVEVQEEQYETQMMLQNDLSYFLKLEIRGINQDRKYCYCVNSKQSLKRVLDLKAIGYEELREILIGLLNALKQLKEYFLKEDSVYLNLDAIYTELERREIYLCYIPGYHENIGIQVRNLMEQLMDAIDHMDQNAVVLVYGLYRITRQENYTLKDLEEFIFHISEGGKEKVEKKSRNRGKNQQILDELFGAVPSDDEEEIENPIENGVAREKRYLNINNWEEEANPVNKNRKDVVKEEMEEEGYHEKKKRGKWWYIALVFDLVVGVCITYLVVLLMSRGLNFKGMIGLGLLILGFFGMSFLAARKEADAKEEEEEMQKAILRSESFKEHSWYEEEDYFYEELKSEEYSFDKKENQFGNQNKTTVLYEESGPKLICIGKKEEQIILDHFPFIIGSRKDGSDYAIMEKGVSRMHADISFEGGMYFITDLNSTNGTFLNEKEIETGKAVRLREGDEIRIAKRRLIIEGIG
ncbi:MAG: FHA domain-containing protein [Lachnospiraceae bacterium]|nr:FHA domain-containing protein [Lachnospiraceae bacterium]